MLELAWARILVEGTRSRLWKFQALVRCDSSSVTAPTLLLGLFLSDLCDLCGQKRSVRPPQQEELNAGLRGSILIAAFFPRDS